MTRGGYEPAGGLASGPKHTTTLTAMHTAAHGTRGTVRYAVTGLSTYSDSKRQTRNAGKIVNECIPAFTGTTSRQLGSPANLHRIVPIGRGLGK